MNDFHYTMDKKGVSDILKSAAMKDALSDAAEKLTNDANRLLHSHDPEATHEYMHNGHDLTHTSVELVHTTGFTTERDQKEHHTLNAINH